MKLITEELISEDLVEAFDGSRLEKRGSRWTLTLPWGREVNITEKSIDLNGITKLLGGEKEEDREQLQFELMSFEEEIRGCVDARKLPLFERGRITAYGRAYGLTVDHNTCRPFGISDAKASFGENASVSNSWRGGWLINLPEGEHVLIGLDGKEMSVKEVAGDRALHARAIEFLGHLQGYAVVRGNHSFCATAMAHGEKMNIKVIPEIKQSFWKTLAIAKVAQWITILTILGFEIALSHGDIPSSTALWGAFLTGWLLPAFVIPFLPWSKWERNRGEALINKFPDSQSGTRMAHMDDVRVREMM